MAELSGLAARLVRARNVEACARMSVDGLSLVLRDALAGLYLESRDGRIKLSAACVDDRLRDLGTVLAEEAAATISGQEPRRSTITHGAEDVHVAAIPLATRGRPFGALVIGRPVRDFSEHDSRVLELLANSTAVAIENARLYQETRRLAITDPITRIYNVRYFRSALSQEVQKARRFRYPMALIMADIDYFKRFNDTYGHPKGNVALQMIARALVRSLRQTDTVARYGGEEFAAILPGCDRSALAQVAEKIRRSVATLPIRVDVGKPPVHVTISVGGTWQEAGELDSTTLLSAADGALYQAKEQGRDRACIWP
jgi:diguanylate cyclase (GGDEF)-like protein